MTATIHKILKKSIAQDLGLEKGDEILSINNEKMLDILDYQYLIKNEEIVLEIKRGKEKGVFEIEKDFEDDLGVEFESPIFDKIKLCANNCIFCFVNQQPEGLRKSLYIKDDDWRLSYLNGTYITLTNLNENDRKRIEKLRVGPFYVSIHTTNPELRIKMLKNPKAGEILKELEHLNKLEIPVHGQIVLCPDYNDGIELKKTLSDLSKFKNIKSVAIVPLGLTKFQKNSFKKVDKKIAKETIKIANGYNFVQCSDEFFLSAEEKIPEKKYYKDFCQLDDGVGTIRILYDEIKKIKPLKKAKNVTILTSQTGEKIFKKIQKELNQKNLNLKILTVKSDFWGEDITITGLITASDIIKTLEKYRLESEVFISSIMLKDGLNTFLDDLTLEEVERQTGVKIRVIKDTCSIKELL